MRRNDQYSSSKNRNRESIMLYLYCQQCHPTIFLNTCLIFLTISHPLQFYSVIQMDSFHGITVADLTLLEEIASTHGGSTQIHLCRYDGNLYVCKIVAKSSVANDAKAIEHLNNEKEALKHFTDMESKYICKLYCTFQDEENLYFLLEMVQGLPLNKLIQMTGCLSLRFSRIVLAQIAVIMENFHKEGYIYRDIKCSNFMVNQAGQVKMIDLGKAKRIRKERTYTICGTTHAMPPEIYAKKGYSYQFDYYSFGVLVYQLLTSNSPFGYATSNPNILEDIQNGVTPESISKIDDKPARSLVMGLLNKNPSQRIGQEGGFQSILNHEFFKNEKEFAMQIMEGSDKLGPYDVDFSEYVSEIEDFGLDVQRFQEVTQDDPFFKFLG